MLVLIQTSPASLIPREVADIEAARAIEAEGFRVLLPGIEEGTYLTIDEHLAREAAPVAAEAVSEPEAPAAPAVKKAKAKG